MSRCSSLCGMTPSSAAIVNSTRSIPCAPGEHVADKALVAGDVDYAGARPVGKREVGKPEIDRDAAFLLFLQPVGLLTGECADQRALAVIDMAGGADNRVRNLRGHSLSLICSATRSAHCELPHRQPDT